MKPPSVFLHLLFLIIAAVQLFSSWTGDRTYEYIAKPFILLWITVYFLLNTSPVPNRWLVLTAFGFSWIGDLLLMLAWKNDLFFFSGVGGFFLSQVFYILAFLKFRLGEGKGLITRKPLLMLPFLIYLAGIYILVNPGLEGLMKPVVLIYAFSLVGMAIAAINRYGLTASGKFWLTLSGALLFLLSDSLLAYNKFIGETTSGGFIIMLTYIAAQYLIMRGLIFQRE